MDKDTATSIVKSLSNNSDEILIDTELELTKAGGNNGYRPYLVAAKIIMFSHRKIVRADEVTFTYSVDSIRNLLNNQKSLDSKLTGIPENQTADIFLESLCQSCENDVNDLGAMVF
jgi:hypothetical protein